MQHSIHETYNIFYLTIEGDRITCDHQMYYKYNDTSIRNRTSIKLFMTDISEVHDYKLFGMFLQAQRIHTVTFA